MKRFLLVLGSALFLACAVQLITVSAAPFPTGVGGTQTSIQPLPGQVLIGNASSGYTPAYILCAGTCTVTTSSGGITITGTGIANNSGNWAGTWQLYEPSDFVQSSTQIVNTVNGSSGVVTITSSSLGVVWPTINGNKAAAYQIVPGTGVTSTVSGATTTLSISLNNGSTQSCSANQFINSLTSAGAVNCGSITFPTPATYTFSPGTGISLSQATSSSNTTTTITNVGVTSFTGQNCVTSPNTTGSISLVVSCLTGNQSILFTLSGDATGTASGTTAITDSVTVIGLNGKLLPANTTGTLQFSQGAWAINLATSSLGVYDANGKLSSYLGSSCGGGQFVTGFSAMGTVACGTPATAQTYTTLGTGNVTTTIATSSSNTTTTVSLAPSGVASGTYTCPTESVATSGVISSASNGSCLTAAITSINTATSGPQTIVGGTGASVTTVSGAGNSTTTVTNTGVTSFTGQNCVTAANSTGTVALTVTCLTGNQAITFTINGDATGTASGTTAITDTVTVTGLNGKALPALATGTLQYTGGAWVIKLATSSLVACTN